MRTLFFFILTMLLFSFVKRDELKEQPIIDRIEFVFNLKQIVERDVWKTFGDKKFDVPLIYFTDTSSYIANPTPKFLSTFKSALIYENRSLKVYRTEKRVDDVPFHMEAGMMLGTPTDEYNYHSPFMKCSSFEVANKTIPGVSSTEEWITMIMHEYFHGFQYKHQPYLDYYESNIVRIQPDSLRSTYKNNSWFKNSINQENELLLKAIKETDKLAREKLIDTFFTVRSERRKNTKQRLNFDIEQYEKCYETMEGTARYIEYSLYNKFATMPPNQKLLKSDTSFKSFENYRNYNIDNDKWLYQTSSKSFFYAIGFNTARLLDKLGIEYKSKLFKEGGISLEEILRARYKLITN